MTIITFIVYRGVSPNHERFNPGSLRKSEQEPGKGFCCYCSWKYHNGAPLSGGFSSFYWSSSLHSSFREEQVLDARELKIVANPEAQVYLFPSLAGYVGGDILSGVVAFDLIERKGLTLYVDIGTNGEIVLIDGENIFCCGTAAGPAFEGAQIKHGTRATLGAISAVEIKDGDIKIYTIGDLAPRGICGTGLIDALACFLREGLLSPTGRFKENDKWSNRLIKEGGSQAFLLSYDPYFYYSGRYFSATTGKSSHSGRQGKFS